MNMSHEYDFILFMMIAFGGQYKMLLLPCIFIRTAMLNNIYGVAEICLVLTSAIKPTMS